MSLELEKIAVIKTFVASKENGEKILKEMVFNKLIACGNVTKIASAYMWEKKLIVEDEWQVMLKTTGNFLDKAYDQLKSLHNYDLPCIIVENHMVNKEYYQWMNSLLSI